MEAASVPGKPLTRSLLSGVIAFMVVLMLVAAAFHPSSSSNPRAATAATTLDARACTQDTGGSCYLQDCYPWRKHATCSWGKCMCPPDKCAYQGTCISPALLPPPSLPVCHMKTGETCAIFSCGKASGAKCSGWSFGFSTGPTLGQCICPEGTCAIDGKCAGKPRAPPATLDANKIVCPVLASLYNAGFLKPDAYGRVERMNVQESIREGLGASDKVAFGFGVTTAGYAKADVDEQNFAMVSIKDAIKLKNENASAPLPGGERYLNIFRMAQNKDVLHQIGAAVRGGPIDPACTTWPCLKREKEFFEAFADSQGRIYTKQLGEIAGNIYKNGFHGVAAKSTLFSKLLGFTGREFLALAGFLVCFGQKDERGDRYLPVEWVRTMLMNGVFPKEWVKRGPGNPQGDTWSNQDILDIINAWRLQEVPGVSDTLKLRTFLRSIGIG